MDARRFTVFPRTGNTLQSAKPVPEEETNPASKALKRKFDSGHGPVDRDNTTFSETSRIMQKVFQPIDDNPEGHYRCIHSVDPEGESPYCLAQEATSNPNGQAYQIVMIRRSSGRRVVGIDKPHPNLLNILSVFRFQDSIFTVFDRPGYPLSEIVVSRSPQLGLAEIKTICTAAVSGICALVEAGLYLPTIDAEDITISASDGEVKIDFDPASTQGPDSGGKATAFASMLENLATHLSSNSVLQQSGDLFAFIRSARQTTYPELQEAIFLKNSLPAPSLIPYVLNAQLVVLPVEHDTETRIIDLKVSKDYR